MAKSIDAGIGTSGFKSPCNLLLAPRHWAASVSSSWKTLVGGKGDEVCDAGTAWVRVPRQAVGKGRSCWAVGGERQWAGVSRQDLNLGSSMPEAVLSASTLEKPRWLWPVRGFLPPSSPLWVSEKKWAEDSQEGTKKGSKNSLWF